jgi:hypothetical protein
METDVRDQIKAIIAIEVERILENVDACAAKLAREHSNVRNMDADYALQLVYEELLDRMHVFDETM